jgi:hypothetical protein
LFLAGEQESEETFATGHLAGTSQAFRGAEGQGYDGQMMRRKRVKAGDRRDAANADTTGRLTIFPAWW